jgi:serine/threonine protein kinase
VVPLAERQRGREAPFAFRANGGILRGIMSSGSSEVPAGGPSNEHSLLGRVLEGRYRIDAVLGKGGVGVVYRAEHTTLGRPVAIKVLHEYFGDREDLRLRFEREAKVLSALAHPQVVAITDYGIAEGMPYLAMELLVGQTLAELLHERRVLHQDEALEISRGILRGLAFAHARGVLHRDLKPANVFLQRLPDDPHHVKLLDFGLAKIVEAEDDALDELTLTRQGTVLGTPAYMSPEQASGATVDSRTDIYSVGCILFELFAGRAPYLAATRPDLIRLHMLGAIPRVADVRPDAQALPELDALLTRALAKDPRQRFADGGDMLAALDALPRPVLSGVPGRPPTGPTPRASSSSSSSEAATVHAKSSTGSGGTGPGGSTPGEAPEGTPRRRSSVWLGLLFAVLGLGVAGLGGVLAWRSAETREDPELDELEALDEVGLVAADRVSRPPAAGPSPAAPEAGAGREAVAAPEARSDGVPGPEQGERAGVEGGAPGPDEAGVAGGAAPDERTAAPEGEGAAAAGDRPPAKYLLAGALPAQLKPYWARVKRGAPLSRTHHKNLRQYQQRFARDPRPSLLLGHDFYQRGWISDALTRYEHAYRFDSAARGDPRMLRNMVEMASMQGLGTRASALVVEIYGAEARSAVERAIAREGDRTRVERLRALQSRL